MELRIQGKKAVVSGGVRGVGRGIVLGLARAGADVLTCYRQPSEYVDSLQVELKEIGGDHHVVQCDLSTPDGPDQLAEEARTRFGRVDTLVNNAGAISHVPYTELEPQEWHRVLDTNVTAAYRLIQQSIPLFGETASVVSIGSKSSEVGIPLRAHYTATKAALVGLSRSLSKEYGKNNWRFNVVALGVIETEAFHALPADQQTMMLDRYGPKIALGRLGLPDEVAGAIVWLASDLSRYVTGSVVNVDGGIT